MQYFSLLLNSAKNLFKPSNDQTISKARYVFIDEVYKANYSSIYHCVLRESRQEVCVKMYKSKKYCKAEREQMEKEIASEISILRKLNHPSILRCFNIFLTSHKAVLETEYMKGGDMYDYLIENGYQTEENVVIIMRQLMSALYYLHQLQIVHRDIKLENILIENPNDISCIKLTDFGLSIELEESTLLTEQVGTSYYMSPELYRKLPYGKKVDMWAIGIVCFALLFGKFPFEGEGKDLVANILRGKFTIPTQPNLSRDCENFIVNLINEKVNKRMNSEEAIHHSFLKGIEIVGSEIVERNNIHQCQSESLLSKLTTSNMDDVGTISEDSEN